MANKLIWSPESLEDIESIAEYIARDSRFYAESTVNKIFEAAQPLLRHPELGRVVPEINNENMREVFVSQYRIIYQFRDKEIHILTVIHGKRNFQKDQMT